MASFDNLTTIDPWIFRSTITDPWHPANDFAIETESALTKALQQSLFNNPVSGSFFTTNRTDYCTTTTTASVSTITGSGSGSVSGSEPETPGCGSKRKVTNLGVIIGKPNKRKSRASKRSTTYIQADPANFRQMVQQVTGAKVEVNGRLPVQEPLRQPFVNRIQGVLPTLDTSAYVFEVQNSNTRRIPVSGTAATSAVGFSQFPARSGVTENGGVGVDFYSYSNFPTLESSI